MRPNPVHHQHRLAMAAEINKKVEAQKTSLYDELRRHEGRIAALTDAINAIEVHKSFVRKDFEEGKIDEPTAHLAMERTDECIRIMGGIRDQNARSLMLIQGRHEQAGETMSICRSLYDEEKRTIVAAIQALEREADETGEEDEQTLLEREGHPGIGLAAQRRAEMHLVEQHEQEATADAGDGE